MGKKVSIIGAGSWGTALSSVLADNGHQVMIWSVDHGEVEMLNRKHEQTAKLPGVILPDTVRATNDLQEASVGRDLLVFAVPSVFVRDTARKAAPYVREGQVIVNVAKGIEEKTLMTLVEVIEEEIPQAKVCVLSGPSHAEEVGRRLPTTVVAGSRDMETARLVQDIFMNNVFRVYSNDDVTGIELGGSLKNVIAIAAGIADGLGFGDNTKAALMTRGIAELSRLGIAMGGRMETFLGLSGIGDLIVTCSSIHSRNRKAGFLIGQGKTTQEAMNEVQQVVEGAYSARAALALAEKYQVDIPIIQEVNAVLFDGKNPADAADDLLLRDRKAERD